MPSADDPDQDVFSAAVYLVTTYKVSGAVVPVISISYGSCETQFSAKPSELRSMGFWRKPQRRDSRC